MRSFIKIFGYMKPYWFSAVMPPILMIVVVRMSLLIPKTTGQIIDLVDTHDLHEVIHLGFLMLMYTLIVVVFTFISNFFSNYSSASMVNDLRIATFNKALNMSFKSLDEFEIGKVITRVTSDTSMLRQMSSMSLRTVFRAPYMLVGAILMIINISPKLAGILALSIPVLFISNFLIVKWSYPQYHKVQENLEDINTFTQENLENIRVVKAFNRTEYEDKRFDELIDRLTATTIKANTITAYNSPIFQVVMNFCTIAVLYIGGLDVMHGDYSYGNVAAFLLYLGQISGALSMINGLINMFPRAAASSKRLLDLINADSEMKSEPEAIKGHPIEGKIEFKNVTFGYTADTPVLKNISFTVNPGERLGIIGTTGSGKTTLISLIPRFYDVTSGEVLIDDKNVQEFDVHTLRTGISTVMQRALLFAGTIGDNIKLGNMQASDDDLQEAARIAEVTEFIDKTPEGYDTILGERGINLSGGQKQRLSMARSIITKPKILIFDDSTSAVDMKTEAKILKSLNDRIDKTTVIIIAQRIRSVMNADHILVLEDGVITGFGTHDELLESNKLYKDIYDTQMGGNE